MVHETHAPTPNPLRGVYQIAWAFLASFVWIGCQDAKTWVKDSKAGYDELAKVARQVNQLALAAKKNDFREAREFAEEAEKHLDTRVLSWAVRLLVIEEKDGLDAARAELQQLHLQEDTSASEKEALEEMENFYRNRSVRLSDALAAMAAVSLESKYGSHGTAAAFMSVYLALRETATIDDINSGTTPTNSATNTITTNSAATQ